MLHRRREDRDLLGFRGLGETEEDDDDGTENGDLTLAICAAAVPSMMGPPSLYRCCPWRSGMLVPPPPPPPAQPPPPPLFRDVDNEEDEEEEAEAEEGAGATGRGE